MYLKSIEVHGFKSFANKIVFEFHNGITGIVGPNGSGKSNVADAVRWVLGEQRAKQLRGASMQDVIFSGTENRKPLSYAYVAITLDNADRSLNIDYNEVTVARRVYRSGESEYLINGTACRLKDVNELFYDTGIGKEGYSIIGQGQIERILSGKPEERRELFDEAAGIVKYKRRKATAQKKLEDERQNLVRVNDILSELEKQVGPLERQSEKAKIYLKKKEELKTYDVNMFLMEMERMEEQLKTVEENVGIVEKDLEESNRSYTNIKAEYEQMEQDMEAADERIAALREEIGNTTVLKGKLEGQINVLKEQIHTAEQSEEHFRSRQEAINRDKGQRQEQKAAYEKDKSELDVQMQAMADEKAKVMEHFQKIQDEIERCTRGIEEGKNEIIELLNNKASTKARQQRYDTMQEQVNIRKAQLSKRLLEQKSEEEELQAVVEECEKRYEEAKAEYTGLIEKEQKLENSRREWQTKQEEVKNALEQDTTRYHREQSRLESLVNIAERYDGYGNSIRRVMEQKEKENGILGVVADIIKVEKKYETAIETALGGSIQNIVTSDEDTAKRMIQYLKQNRYGRATFLPLTSVGKKQPQINENALKEQGVIGIGSDLVQAESKYNGLKSHLLGRTYVVDTIDHAVALARKYQYTLRIVTLEGESLSPGGSMTGGAFKNTSNLLGRKREIEELEKNVAQLKENIAKYRNRMEEIATARELLKEDLEQLREDLKQAMLNSNTAKLNMERAKEQKEENDGQYSGLIKESKEIEEQLSEITQNRQLIQEEILQADKREKEIEEESGNFQKILEEQNKLAEESQKDVSRVQLEEANLVQKAEFIQENISRVQAEIQKLDDELKQAEQEKLDSQADVDKKYHDIEEIKKTMEASDSAHGELEQKLSDSQKEREEMSVKYKGFFQKQEELSKRINDLDKESFRLNSQKEKLNESIENQTNYMWEEYELTRHNALELRNEEYDNLAEMKKQIAQIKDDIRKLGDVNVNAIEDYKNLSERYTFMKTQHDDLVTAERTLLDIIEELDTGMRKQFMEKFREIQIEFDKVFKELFGGGKGTLELVEGEDILECGIRIIAQPPGKKLQNMMQLSGGEKSLTAISLLFAIQNLKPSPFCLLDEIEAALDDSNVGRFANYLHKLTKNTQFIVITHRRGTMAAADRLYGITMQEKGVSTLVSVNLIEEELDK
ncbi:chromosome segregation protein SMC [Roseburia sp. 499]|uniref:chromosome segregation protein SMC n=1 Tax=Roseburia sp. 499 TaxID=1261634 RepID=UPI000951CA3A|nr:chromosome segregation protein SMC [Roseburia sp. 499]WVK70889.1 chromosome segregation protein SMC [Roseburia sp. 499]